MKRMTLIAAACVFVLCGSAQAGLTAWINEFHYDNAGSDTIEFVEVVLHSSLDPADYNVDLYNGNGGESYGTHNVGDFQVGDTVNGYIIYFEFIGGIQNGSPDGLALSDTGGLVEFLSYEGSFTGVGGPADGVTSTDIGVSQPNDTPVGSSLGLTGNYPSFTWAEFNSPLSGSGGATFGEVNFGQTIPAPGAVALLGLAGLAGARRRRRAG